MLGLREFALCAIRRTRFKLITAAALAVLVGAACATSPTASTPTPVGDTATQLRDAPLSRSIADGGDLLSPILRELNPSGPKEVLVDAEYFERGLPRDYIRPIYNPSIATAAEARVDSDELVIGVSIGGRSRAYPLRTLRFREMVNDELAGVPILVTW